VQVTLEREPERPAGGRELLEAHVAEFGFAESEIAETEGEINVGVELGQEPGCVSGPVRAL
jgi:hypothetical protein